MSKVFLSFSDKSLTQILAVYGGSQSDLDIKNYVEVESDDDRYREWYAEKQVFAQEEVMRSFVVPGE